MGEMTRAPLLFLERRRGYVWGRICRRSQACEAAAQKVIKRAYDSMRLLRASVGFRPIARSIDRSLMRVLPCKRIPFGSQSHLSSFAALCGGSCPCLFHVHLRHRPAFEQPPAGGSRSRLARRYLRLSRPAAGRFRRHRLPPRSRHGTHTHTHTHTHTVNQSAVQSSSRLYTNNTL